MRKILSIIAVGVFIAGLMMTPFTSPVQAQSYSVCGYFHDDGYIGMSFYYSNGTSIPTMYTRDDIRASFGIDPSREVVWVMLIDPVYNRVGVLTGVGRVERTSSCGNSNPAPAPIAPSAPTYTQMIASPITLRLSPDCTSGIHVTYSDITTDWQNAAANAIYTWGSAGSALQFNGTNTVVESDRTFELADYDGIPIKWYPVGTYLHLAKCEVRMILASSLHDDTLASVASHVSPLSQLPAWVMPFAYSNTNLSVAALVILNDYNFNWSTLDIIKPGYLDLQSLMTHELGHAVGMYHLTDTQSVMTGDELNHLFQLWVGVSRRTLSKADLDQLNGQYGYAASTPSTSSIDLGKYCIYKYGSSAWVMLRDRNDAFTWSCYVGNQEQPGIDMNEACRTQHPYQPYAILGSRWDAYSWACSAK